MAEYILFVPWSIKQDPAAHTLDERPGFEYAHKNNQWIASEPKFFQVWYTGQKSPLLSQMRGGQIYIRGHSKESLGQVFSGNVTVRDKNNIRIADPIVDYLDANVVADRLIETGLHVDFAGKLKCYNCWGAALGGKNGFAQKFADYMWDKRYRNCSFFGYRGALDSFRDANPNDPFMTAELKGHKTVKMKDGTLKRASQERDQIIPSQVKSS